MVKASNRRVTSEKYSDTTNRRVVVQFGLCAYRRRQGNILGA
jgi:hypothetical protein